MRNTNWHVNKIDYSNQKLDQCYEWICQWYSNCPLSSTSGVFSQDWREGGGSFFSHNLRSLVVPIILCKYLGKICNVSHYSDMLQLSQIVCIFWNISVALAGTSRSCFANSEENLIDPFLLLENRDILRRSRKCINLTTIIVEASLCTS